jgi:hypothetical protein
VKLGKGDEAEFASSELAYLFGEAPVATRTGESILGLLQA